MGRQGFASYIVTRELFVFGHLPETGKFKQLNV